MRSRGSSTVVLIPIRSFDDSKSRLAEALEPGQRRRLTEWMAARVVAAAHDLPVRVVSDDADVIAWAHTQRVRAMPVGVGGLNPSITAAVARAAASGFSRAIIAHADLPAADDLRVVTGPGVAVAPDRARDGSNVLSLPTGAAFDFAYGPGSFDRHRAEAKRRRLPFTVIDDDSLAWDVDDPADLPTDWTT